MIERQQPDKHGVIDDLDVDEIDHARSWLADPGTPASEPAEETASRFARVVVKLADKCVIGLPCEKHYGMVHGQEAEELRKGIEQILKNKDGAKELRRALISLLDQIDARDSLAFLESKDSKEAAR